MEYTSNFIVTNIGAFIAVAALLCGVALLYLVMIRTYKHRKDE